MRVADLKALARERGLRSYSRLRKAELIALLQNNSPAPRTRQPRPTGPAPQRPPPPPLQSFRFRPDRPRQTSSQEMDIFEQKKMSKSQSQVTSKLNDW